jgi:phage-related minor tail protein
MTAVGMLGTALFAVITPITAVVGAIAGLVYAGILLYQNWDKVKGGLIAILEVIKGAFLAAWEWINERVIQKIIGGFMAIKEYVIDVFFEEIKEFWENMKETFKEAVDWIMEHTIGKLIEGFEKVINLARRAKDAVAGVGGRVKGGAIQLGETIKGLVPKFADGGIVTRPTLGLVGEAGPEAIIPLSQLGRGGGTNINITVNGDVSGTELVEKVKRQIFKEVNRQIKL